MATIPSLLTVSYSVLADKEADFQGWLQQLGQIAAKTPGFLGLGIDRDETQSAHGEWKVTYKFQTAAQRDQWADSAKREKAHLEGRAFLTSERQESRTSEGGSARVIMVVKARIDTTHQKEWEVVQADLNVAVSKYAGFEGLDIFKPQGTDNLWTTVLSFRTEEDMQRWRDSGERQSLLERAQSLSENEVQFLPGTYGQWFSANATASAQSPAWKQAMVVLLVLFPLVTLYDITLGNMVGQGLSVEGHPVFKGFGIPFPAVVFLGNAVGTVVLTWVVMPVITRVFDWWLNPFATLAQTLRGTGLIVFLYVIEIIAFVYVYWTWGF
jgi:antibiotic biosynthesis monooxygenase (ABM) superfamily enzyme